MFRKHKYLIFLLVFTIIMSISSPIAYANNYGTGAAGDVVISSTVNLSSYANKNFRNLTINAGGNLIVNTDDIIYVSQILTIRNGGRITSSNGANGHNYWNDNSQYITVSATPAKDIKINASQIVIENGSNIISGNGATGNPGYFRYSYEYYLNGSGSKGGDVVLNSSSISLTNSYINTGDGGNPGSNPISGTTAGNGGPSGNITINATIIELVNSFITTGLGRIGSNANAVWHNSSYGGAATAGFGGVSGDVNFTGITLTIDANSYIRPGTAGRPGNGLKGNELTKNQYSRNGSKGGNVNITGFATVNVLGYIQGGTGSEGGYRETMYNQGGTSGYPGGAGGDVIITGANTVLSLQGSGRLLGGVPGKGSDSAPPKYLYDDDGPVYLYGGASGGTGGQGGGVTLDVKDVIFSITSQIVSADGARGGHASSYLYTWIQGGVANKGGDGGKGGTVSFKFTGALTKDVNTYNIKTGRGGDAGTHGRNYYSSGDSMFDFLTGGTGGQSGDLIITFPIVYNIIDILLAELGAGGNGTGITINYNSQNYGSKTITPGAGGAIGNITINGTNLSFNRENILRTGNSGLGNTYVGNTAIKSNNGNTGNITINSNNSLTFNSNNAIYIGNVTHGDYSGPINQNNVLTLNSEEIKFNVSKPIRWSNENGGTLAVVTVLDKLLTGFDQWDGLFKETGKTIFRFNFNFTYSTPANTFKDIPAGLFQTSQEVSYNMDHVLFDRYLKTFSNYRKYYSEDNGASWLAITDTFVMARDYTWFSPSTLKGNSNIKIGITPYGYANARINSFIINGKTLNTFWAPNFANPPLITSHTFAIVDGDVSPPVVSLRVNNKGADERIVVSDTRLNISIKAIDNLTKDDKLKYLVGFNNTNFVEVPFLQINNFQYNIADYFPEGNVPSGNYNIIAKVLDENFNAGISSLNIYYIKPSDVPTRPELSQQNPAGIEIRDNLTNDTLSFTTNGSTDFIYSRNNVLELSLTTSPYPFYQVSLNNGQYSSLFSKNTPYRLVVPPGDGFHQVNIRYATADGIGGEEYELLYAVSKTIPEFDADINITAVKLNGAAYREVPLDISYSGSSLSTNFRLDINSNKYSSLNIDLGVNGHSQVLLRVYEGLNNITLRVKDSFGNISRPRIIKIWGI